jgi:hypothetical protein
MDCYVLCNVGRYVRTTYAYMRPEEGGGADEHHNDSKIVAPWVVTPPKLRPTLSLALSSSTRPIVEYAYRFSVPGSVHRSDRTSSDWVPLL